MKSPTTKYKVLKFLMVFALVIAVCATTVAENNEDSNEVSMTVTKPVDVNSDVRQDSKKQEVSTTVIGPDTNIAVNKDSNEPPTTLEQRMQKKISVDFINTPIEDVIKMIAEQANVDIIKSPTVTGSVTAKLTNVPLEEVLDNILAVHGCGCVINKNMIRVAPLDEIAQKEEILDRRVYHITYADIVDVESALKKIITKRGSISSSIGTSDIIVVDSESNIKAMDSFIEKIDRVTPQVLVEVRIYDVTSTEGFDIGAEWGVGRNNPITIVDTHQDITVNNLISATTTNTTDTDKDTETAWQENTAAGSVSGDNAYLYRKSKPFVGGSFDADTAGTIRLGLLDTINVELALNVLRTQVGAKLLANPRILVLDNEIANFEIVSEIPYTEQSTTSSGGSMTSTQFKKVGIELKVTPHVTRDSMVRLHIVPEFSVVSELGSIIPNSGGLRGVPTIDARKADTKALVKDGQTVVLGGLRKRTVSQDISKIPILGDLPLLGGAFSEVSEEVETNELIIFITPRIVTEPILSPRELNGLEATEFGGPKVTYTGDEKAEKVQK